MPRKLIVDFLTDWIRHESIRQKVLHKEKTGLKSEGLTEGQINVLRKFRLSAIAKQISSEIGVDLDELRRLVWPDEGDVDGAKVVAGGYDEGSTHIRRVDPKVVTVGTESEVVLWGHGFKSDPSRITVQFVTGPEGGQSTVEVTATDVECGIDVWQRVRVSVTLDVEGEWVVRAHNDDDFVNPNDPAQGYVWSDPVGVVSAI